MTMRRRAILFTLLMLAAPVVGMGLWLRSARHQYSLNRQLIDALVKEDDKRALVLVNVGADPNTRYKPMPVPSLAVLAKQLFHRSPPPVNDSPTALFIACGAIRFDIQEYNRDDTRLIQAMLAHGAKVNAMGEDGETALGWAIFAHRHNAIDLLLEHGAKVNIMDSTGWTPLIEASQNADSYTMRLLVERRAEINAKNQGGWTALMYAVENEVSSDTLLLLLKHGAKVNVRMNHARTPLMESLRFPGIVRLLIQYRADVNAQDDAGETALWMAVQVAAWSRKSEDKDVVRLLLAHGANANLANHQGQTALTIAEAHHCPDLVALLRRYGAKQ